MNPRAAAKARRKRQPPLVLANPDLIRRIARIMDPSSAAQKALDEFDRRTAAGENVAIFTAGTRLLVGPAPQPAAPTADQVFEKAMGDPRLGHVSPPGRICECGGTGWFTLSAADAPGPSARRCRSCNP